MAGSVLESKWARTFVNSPHYSEEDSEAIRTLSQAGYYVTTIPVSNLGRTEVKVGSKVYVGLEEITELAQQQTRQS